METGTIREAKDSIKHWYFSLILGIILIAVGIWVFLTPVSSYIALSILFSITFLIAGIMEITFSVVNRGQLRHWGWTLVGGIVDLLIGILLISQPALSLVVLPFYVGFAILFRSIMAIGWAIELKRQAVADWGYVLIFGILGAIFSFILLWNPLFAGMTIVFYTALAFIMAGCFQVYLSLKLRKLSNAV